MRRMDNFLTDLYLEPSNVHAFLDALMESHMSKLVKTCEAVGDVVDIIKFGDDLGTNNGPFFDNETYNEFGKDITFWGDGCDTKSILNRATPEEVKTHVLRNLEIFNKGGGYVFNTVHNIMPDVPPENIVAMFDTVNEYNGSRN
jgi:uroporphyrinogen decarboxylase